MSNTDTSKPSTKPKRAAPKAKAATPKEQAAPSLPPVSESQQQQGQDADPKPERKPKEVGKQNFSISDVPQDFKDLAQLKFGTVGQSLKHSESRANGTYKGVVLVSDHFIAQKVGENSVVYHKKEDIEFKNQNLEWRNKEKKLNGISIGLYYTDANAKAYPHSTDKDKGSATNNAPAGEDRMAKFARMIEGQKETAKELNLPGLASFNANLDKVRDAMILKAKEHQQAARPQPQQDR